MGRSLSGGLFVVCLAVLLASMAAPADDKKPKDKGDKDKVNDKVGIRWEYTVTKGGEPVESGTFRAHQFTIYNGALKRGTYRQPAKDHVILTLDSGKLKGTVDLRQTDTKPRPVWRGEYKSAEGEKYRIVVKFLDD